MEMEMEMGGAGPLAWGIKDLDLDLRGALTLNEIGKLYSVVGSGLGRRCQLSKGGKRCSYGRLMSVSLEPRHFDFDLLESTIYNKHREIRICRVCMSLEETK